MNYAAKTTITAVLPTTEFHNAQQEDKELVATLTLVGAKEGDLSELAAALFWMGRSKQSSVVYCSVWVHGRAQSHGFKGCSGRGRAGGGGYDKKSAALEEAIRSAGIKLSEAIAGRGESSSRNALFAIGEALGYQHEHMLIV